ncbi:MAG: hypothetical protein KDH94_02525, partial [Coxiellaceae bacterium]|nr:hypothetical protein [Coxiellaceae bacterium]
MRLTLKQLTLPSITKITFQKLIDLDQESLKMLLLESTKLDINDINAHLKTLMDGVYSDPQLTAALASFSQIDCLPLFALGEALIKIKGYDQNEIDYFRQYKSEFIQNNGLTLKDMFDLYFPTFATDKEATMLNKHKQSRATTQDSTKEETVYRGRIQIIINLIQDLEKQETEETFYGGKALALLSAQCAAAANFLPMLSQTINMLKESNGDETIQKGILVSTLEPLYNLAKIYKPKQEQAQAAVAHFKQNKKNIGVFNKYYALKQLHAEHVALREKGNNKSKMILTSDTTFTSTESAIK